VCSDGTRVEAVTASDSFVGDIGIIATGASALPSGATSSGGHTVRPVHGITLRVRGLDRSAQPMIRSFVKGGTFLHGESTGRIQRLGRVL